MSIERTLPLSSMTGGSALQDKLTYSTTRQCHTSNKVESQPAPVQVTLSELSRQIDTDNSRDIHRPRLEQIRAAMEAGELMIDSDSIAIALVDDIFQLN